MKFGWMLCILTGVVAVEVVSLSLYVVVFFPRSIPLDIARAVFEKVIDVDTAMLGFTGLIVAVSMQNWKRKFKQFLAVLAPVVGFLLISMAACFGAIVGIPSSFPFAFYIPLASLMMAVTLLFFLLATLHSGS
jgi:hypothetical protein